MNDSFQLLYHTLPQRSRRESSPVNTCIMPAPHPAFSPDPHRSTQAQKRVPSLSSALVTHFLLTLSTALLATLGFVTALTAALSCEFLSVRLDVGEAATARLGGSEDLSSNADSWYYNEIAERQEDHTASIGFFCSSSIQVEWQELDDSRIRISKGFLITSLVLGAFLLSLTCAISTFMATTDRLWNVISFTSVFSFLCELPIFFILDSLPCQSDDVTCSLASGSFSLLCSMICYVLLALITQWKGPPDWKDEYELWRFIRQNSKATQASSRGDEELGDCSVFADQYVTEHDTCGNIPVYSNPLNVQTEESTSVIRRSVFADQNVAEHDTRGNIPVYSNPLNVQTEESTSIIRHSTLNATPSDGNVRTAKTSKKMETFNFVGKYIDIETDPCTPTRERTGQTDISPITHITELEGGTIVIDDFETKTELSHNLQKHYVDLIHRELQKSLQFRESHEEQPLHEIRQRNHQFSELSHVSFPSTLELDNFDNNCNSFNRPVLKKDDLKHVFGDVTRDLSVILSDCCEEGGAKHRTGEKQPSNVDDVAVSKSVPSISTFSVGRPSVKQGNHANMPSIKSIFRKRLGTEHNSAYRNIGDSREEIMEQWMLEETSLGKTNSDDLDFLDKNPNAQDASVHSRLSKVTAKRSSSRCTSPVRCKDQSSNHRGDDAAVPRPSSRCVSPHETSPTMDQIQRSMNSEVISPNDKDTKSCHSIGQVTSSGHSLDMRNINGTNVISPDKNDPGVEMYPSDSSLSTLSLPTVSDHHTDSDSDGDHKSKSSRKIEYQYASKISICSSESDSEISQIIAGVQRINRRTCGKITPLNKRQRRRKHSYVSGGMSQGTDYSSCSGSLLDEIIDEEGELNDSGEATVPTVIVAMPRKKSTSPRKKSKSPKKKMKCYQALDDSDGANSGYGSADVSDYSSTKGQRQQLETDESNSSVAARARRNRLVTKRQVHDDPEAVFRLSQLVSENASDASGRKSSSYSFHAGSPNDGSSFSKPTECCDTDTPMYDDSGNISWQARKSRISRLRMQRQASDPIVRGEGGLFKACSSDEASI